MSDAALLLMLGLGGFVLIALAVGAVVLILTGTARKTRWGVNLQTGGRCPRCATPIPMVRKPTTLRQALWGGWTCTTCGAELDKWGRQTAGGGDAT